MARRMTRTWWGERFLEALEQRMDYGRLSRGRAYSGPNRMLDFSIQGAKIKAKLRGNTNPYFGVYEEPEYRVSIQLKTIAKARWQSIIKDLAGNAAWLSRLILNEMPDNIQQVFVKHNANLLPGTSSQDLSTKCSCPDWANPCKHVAGTYYKVASLLDRDPFLLFELRGMEKSILHQNLAESPLGKALLSQITQPDAIPLEIVEHRFTHPGYEDRKETTFKTFWHGETDCPSPGNTQSYSPVSAALIKKQGAYPPFWDQDQSFVEVMEAVYQRISDKNKIIL